MLNRQNGLPHGWSARNDVIYQIYKGKRKPPQGTTFLQ